MNAELLYNRALEDKDNILFAYRHMHQHPEVAHHEQKTNLKGSP